MGWGRQIAALYPACSRRCLRLLALMESADLRLTSGAGPHHHPVTRGRGERHNGFLISWQDWDPVDLLGCIYRAPDVMPSTMDVR